VPALTCNTPCLRTARLDLVAATVEHLSAELESPQRLAAVLGADVPASWPPGEYNRHSASFFRARLGEGGIAVAGWYSWYAIRRATASEPALLVASGGYCGPPSSDGTVDIGYSVVPECRGRGFAMELVQALVTRAFEAQLVNRVLTETHVDNIASTAVLKRCGFRHVAAGLEPGYLRFQRDRHPTT
jgi:RimJ/RimL family protein N-acetyltransferase